MPPPDGRSQGVVHLAEVSGRSCAEDVGMTNDTTAHLHDIDLASRLLAAINDRNFDGAAALLAPEYRSEWPDAELDLNGSFEREITMMTGLPDTRFGIDSVSSIGDGRVLVEATVTGTHTGVLQLPHGVVLQPSGRSVSLQFVLLLRFVDGRLVHERLFFDHHELIHQLTSAA